MGEKTDFLINLRIFYEEKNKEVGRGAHDVNTSRLY